MPESIHPQNQPDWYALRIRSNQEKIVASMLENKGYEQFLPLYRSTRRWSDRVKQLDLPLFPGYLFCRLDPVETVLPVLTTPGVVSIAGTGRVPLPVPDEEIEAVRTVIRSGLATMPWPGLTVGSKVLIERGPLTGLEGVAINVGDQCRLVVSVQLLQRSLAVTIERSWARPISNTARIQTSLAQDSRGSSTSQFPLTQHGSRAVLAP